jgi:hypothetical protein
MNDIQTRSGGDGREFYAPATFQFSTEPGRIERALVRLFGRRGEMAGRPRSAIAVREFYAPATFQFSATPGRIERTATRLFRRRGETDGRSRDATAATSLGVIETTSETTSGAPAGRMRRQNAR